MDMVMTLIQVLAMSRAEPFMAMVIFVTTMVVGMPMIGSGDCSVVYACPRYTPTRA